MDLLSNIGLGLSVAALPYNLLFCFIGVLLGTLIGVLPGLGPLATIAMLLPLTFVLPPFESAHHACGDLLRRAYGGSRRRSWSISPASHPPW